MLSAKTIANLSDQLQQAGPDIYILIDAARADSIEELLRASKADAVSLLKAGSDRDLSSAGPWMISSHVAEDRIIRDIAFADAFGGAVCWAGHCPRENAMSHFRRLNAARLPDERLVFFRHYDPDVLASVVAICDDDQTAKIFGLFTLIGFVGGTKNGQTQTKPQYLTPPTGGPISFTASQLMQLNDRQEGLLCQSIAKSLRQMLPNKTKTMSNQELHSVVTLHIASGKYLGVHSERGFAQWSYLNTATDGRIAGDTKRLRSILLERHLSVDEALENEIDHILIGYNRVISK